MLFLTSDESSFVTGATLTDLIFVR